MTAKETEPPNPTMRIATIRGRKVILARDLAKLYGIPTQYVTRAIRRHPNSFSEDFAFQLTRTEYDALIEQGVFRRPGTTGWSRYLPWALTENGVALLSFAIRGHRLTRAGWMIDWQRGTVNVSPRAS